MTRRYATSLLIVGLLVTGCRDVGTNPPDGALGDSGSPAVTSSATPTPTPTPTDVATPKPPKHPRPRAHVPKPAPPRKPVVRRPSHRPPVRHTSRYVNNVHPGAFCKPAGALGRTSAGTVMQCKGPGQPRWRRA